MAQGCAKDLTPTQEQPAGDASTTDAPGVTDGPPKTTVVPGPKVTTKDLGDGVNQVTINSTDEGAWIYFSFSFQRQAEPKDPSNSSDWDIAFQRFKIKSNSGISGSGGVEVTYVEDQSFDAIRNAPADGYITDKEDGDDEDTDPDYVFLADKGWYAYNFQDHTLKPRPRVYILKDVEGQYYKIEFTAYYDGNGNSGFPTFRFAKIQPPKAEPPQGPPVSTKDLGDGVTQVQINAAEAGKWVYYSFATNAEVKTDKPNESKAWALGFQRFQIKTNGGENGQRGITVAYIDDQDFAALKQAPKDGYVADAKDGDDADEEPDWGFLVGGAWYAYDPMTHSLAARKRVYVVKVDDKTYYKVQMLSYYTEAKVSGFPTFQWAKIDPPQ